VKEEAARYGIPLIALSSAQAQGGSRGVCQHRNLGAWGGGHVDCGAGFPMDEVIRQAKAGGPSPIVEELMMQPAFMVKGAQAKTPVAVPPGAKRLRLFSHRAAQVHVDLIGETQPKTDDFTLSYDAGGQTVALGAATAVVLTRVDDGPDEVSFVLSA